MASLDLHYTIESGDRRIESGVIRAEDVPDYPVFEMLKAKGGEKTQDLKVIKGSPPLTYVREAKPGELLRDTDMKFIADVSANEMYRAEVKLALSQNPHLETFYWECCRSNILYFINTL